MEYAYEKGYRIEIKAIEAKKGKQYVCPYCGEDRLTLNQGSKNKASFSHEKIKERNVLQRTCPEYKGEDKIDSEYERLYIRNGGIPVYLKNQKQSFNLYAIFPSLSEETLLKAKNDNLVIVVNGNEKYNLNDRGDSIIYKIENNKLDWINIVLKSNKAIDIKRLCYYNEIKQKWLCGIKGVNKISSVLYECYENGGYRLSENSFVFLNRDYYFICSSYEKVKGINSQKVGEIRLNDLSYYVFKLNVFEINPDSKRFISSKNYFLIKENYEIIPLWPPATILGKELVYNTEEALLTTMSSNYKVYESISKFSQNEHRKIDRGIFKIKTKEWYGVYSLIQDQSIKREIIQWHISYRSIQKSSLEYYYDLINAKTNLIHPGKVEHNNIDFKNLKVKSNIPVKIVIKKGEYVLHITTGEVYDIEANTIIITMSALGNKKYNIVAKNKEIHQKNNFDELSMQMYKCLGEEVDIDKKVLFFYRIIPDEYKALKKIIKYWIFKNKIPISAKKIIYKTIEKRG